MQENSNICTEETFLNKLRLIKELASQILICTNKYLDKKEYVKKNQQENKSTSDRRQEIVGKRSPINFLIRINGNIAWYATNRYVLLLEIIYS